VTCRGITSKACTQDSRWNEPADAVTSQLCREARAFLDQAMRRNSVCDAKSGRQVKMDHQRADAQATHPHALLRVIGAGLGSLVLVWATFTLMRTAWDQNRMAILDDMSMYLTLPLVTGGYFLSATGLVLLASGQWPPRGIMRTAIKAGAAFVAAAVIAWMLALGGSSELARNPTVIVSVLLLAGTYIGIGAVVGEWWLALLLPGMTAPVVFIMAAWAQLATDNVVHGGAELEMAGAFLGLLIWVVLVPAAFVLTTIGILIGSAFHDRAD
jgi:hypothetical protein